jgi:hypothetical protein
VAVTSYREVIPRTYEHKIGGSPTATRVFVATVDAPTGSSEVIGSIGIQHGSPHPDHGNLTCDGFSADETDRHHVTVTYTYSVPDPEDPEDPEQPPWLQPDSWAFSTTNASVACTEHYPFVGNNVSAILANTAGDAIFGISRAEAELKISISGSRLVFNLAAVKQYVNCINRTPWAGFPPHTVQCVGVSASPARLEWQDQVIDYWQITIELVYRSSSHDLFLPNVGFHVIAGGKKQRAWTYVEQDGERVKVPAPHPVALNMQGGFLCGPDQDGARGPNGGTPDDDQTSYFGAG